MSGVLDNKNKVHPRFIKDIKAALNSGKPELVKKLKILAIKEKGQEKRLTKKIVAHGSAQ